MCIHKQPLVKWRISERERQREKEYLMGIVISHLFYYEKKKHRIQTAFRKYANSVPRTLIIHQPLWPESENEK